MVFLYHALHVPIFWSGVDLFFVLSGYLITGILLRLKEQQASEGESVRWWRAFYVRRACRILPPYVAFLGIVSLFFRVPWSHTWFWYAFFNANVANATHHEGVRAMVPLWSLAVEEQFYLVWPWVVVLGSRRTLKRIALGIIVATPVLRAICTPSFSSHWPIYCLTPFRVDTLACGAFIAILAYEDFAWIDRNHYRAFIYTMVAVGCPKTPLHEHFWCS
jgi:peptidoglycan/LPS O-acetylase OafA/YrhL